VEFVSITISVFPLKLRRNLAMVIIWNTEVYSEQNICASRKLFNNKKFIHSFIYGSIALCWALADFFSFVILYTVSRTPWTGDRPASRPLLHIEQHKQNKRTKTYMPRVGVHNLGSLNFGKNATFRTLIRIKLHKITTQAAEIAQSV
jgi:hypothetical protein